MSESKSRGVKKKGGGGHQNMSGKNLEAFAGELLYPSLPYPVLSCILYHREHIEEERLVVDEGDKLGDKGEELEGEK